MQNNNVGINEENEYIRLVNELIKKIPVNDLNKTESLKRVIWYLGAILFGDGIHSFSAINYHSEYAKEAISELVKYAQLNSIENFGVIIENLRQELCKLESQKASLSLEVSTLVKECSELKEQTAFLKKEKDKLESYKIELTTEIKELEDSVKLYEQKIMNYENGQTIIWEPIDENHPIYGLSYYTIDNYIEAILKDYAEKANISVEAAKNVFYIETPVLFSLRSYLKHNLEDIYANMTVREILNMERLNINCYAYDVQQKIKSIIKDMKMYRVVNKNNKSFETNKSETTQNALKELKIQKKLLEAISKQKIAEQQLEMVISLLSKNIPSEKIFESINNLSLDAKIEIEDKKDKRLMK